METSTKVCNCCGRELTIDHFRKTRWGGYSQNCNECLTKHILEARNANKQQKAQEATRKSLSTFTPRELMQELARRGYEGKLTYTRVEEIDITNF